MLSPGGARGVEKAERNGNVDSDNNQDREAPKDMDEDTPEALEGRDGSNDFPRQDLRSSPPAC